MRHDRNLERNHQNCLVMPAEVPGIHEFTSKTWMAGTSPAMTKV